MKILIINSTERIGGAAIAANRLMRALRKNGAEARMLTAIKQTDNPATEQIAQTSLKRFEYKARFLYERFTIFLANRFSKKNLFKISLANTGFDILQHPLVKEADILHLHWVNMGFLSLENLRHLISSGKPIIWTLHDLWPVTGICHYPGTCRKYQMHCFSCPYQPKKNWKDLASSVYDRKITLNLNAIHFNGCSRWITEEASQSGLARAATFSSIPNPIDTKIFYPKERSTACHKFNLDPGKKYLLFVADNIHDQRKGIRFLIEACRMIQLPDNKELEILLLGKNTEDISRAIPFLVHTLGYLNNENDLTNAYSCADVFVIPSLEDNLPNTILEAMSCATPCVGFNTGGIPEIIDHLKNGYIAEKENAADLAKGISWALDHPDKNHLDEEARIKVTGKFSEEIIATQFINLYKQLNL